MDGILNINKPPDMTSFGVVAAVKRITRERHTGHAGTLDPLATGVLPVCLGQATRVIQYLFNETKTYRAEVELGVTTDTYDSTGKVLQTRDAAGISREMVEAALSDSGAISDKHLRCTAPSNIRAVRCINWPGPASKWKENPARRKYSDWKSPIGSHPVVTLDVVCGKGTYIRSLAHDLGEALGCGANMKSLVRLRVGPFGIEEAVNLVQLEEFLPGRPRTGLSVPYRFRSNLLRCDCREPRTAMFTDSRLSNNPHRPA